ncbi:MAG: SUMF1/EgtB/PvdO family nonheme iron enzyme [Candidatus Binatia bacterium]
MPEDCHETLSLSPSLSLSLCALASLAAPLVANAADVKVGYLLETKPFKTAIAGTPLTLSIYTDDACTGSPAATEIVNSDALQLIEPLKRTTPKGGTKPPGTSRVEHVISGVTAQPLFYLAITGAGVVPVGGACQVQHAAVNGSDAVLPPPPPPVTCAPDSVQTAPGQPCVDKYEASLWDIPPAQTVLIQKVKDGTATLADLTGGGATQLSIASGSGPYCSPNIPGTFPYDGHYTAPLYAVSIPGVKPTVCITAYQSAVACQLSDKRLLTGAEWLAAGAGTVDTNTDDGSTDCDTNAPPTGNSNQPVNTGSRSACVSTSGTFDQIGNVYEWTLDRTTDVLTGVPSASTWIRGGNWDSGASASLSYGFQLDPVGAYGFIGFRCGR